MGIFSNDSQTIRIECEGALLVDIDDVKWFQGELKTLSEEDYVKLRNSITELGFSDPLNIWIDSSGTKWIHDGHERVFTLKKMRDEGWTIPKLPASVIKAKDAREAKKKLVANDSHYGKITEKGLTDFLNEDNITFEEVEDFVELADVDLDREERQVSDTDDDAGKTEACEVCTSFHENNHELTS